MAVELVDIDPWVDVMQVRLDERLPTTCGGAVGYLDDDGLRWVLLDPHLPWRRPADPATIVEWADGFVDEHRFITPRAIVEQLGVPLEEARGAFWLVCVEWWPTAIS